MVNNIQFTKLHEDTRGAVYSIRFQDKDWELIEIVRGAVRGGHYHTYDSELIVLYGRITYREVTPRISSSERQLILSTKDTVTIPAGVVHLAIGIEDSLLLERRESSKYEAINYPPYRKLVEEYLNNSWMNITHPDNAIRP